MTRNFDEIREVGDRENVDTKIADVKLKRNRL